jgi:anion-transporting  ArsA/GET3 family ATPase
MAKRVRGHRANKPNDSFGTTNDGNLYRGKYREEVYKDEDDDAEETVDAKQADPEEATPQESQSFVQQKQEPDHDYKKRYDDLKKHYDTKVEEFKAEIDSLKQAMSERKVEMPRGVEAPNTMEELDEFKKKYPEVFQVVQTVSMMQSESQLSELREELGTIKEREKNLEKQNAYQELLNYHPDFDTLKQEEKFVSWLEEQPSSIADGIYKNNTDAKLAARVIDLYKADVGQTKKKPNKSASAAESVTKPAAREVVTANKDGRIWKASEIGKMKPWEFEKLESELDAARQEGRIDYNN